MKTQPFTRAAATFCAAALAALPAAALAARRGDEDAALPAAPSVEIVDAASRTAYLVVLVLVVLILLPVAFLVYRKLFGAVAGAPGPAADRDPLAAAAAEEARGNQAAAAAQYDAAGDKLKAAACWEKAKDLVRAADCYEAAGELEKAAQLHVRSGGALRAAGIYMRTKNYIEAAKIFRNKGDHLRAAQALELFGNKLAAAREYSEAGNHARAARLLEEEKLYAEAAAAYEPLLGTAAPTPQTADRFATHATLLALAGDAARAGTIYERVLTAVPGHPRAQAGLLRLRRPAAPAPPPDAAPAPAAPGRAPLRVAPDEAGIELVEGDVLGAGPAPPPAVPPPPPEDLSAQIEADAPAEAGDPLKRVFTLRDMIRAGRMEPRYSMRLWVQVMRALAERHRGNQVLGCVTPESITVDMENNVRLEPPADRPAEYLSPEVQAGLPPDRQADIYSMGVVLFELVTGSTEQLGRKRAGELFKDVPAWLDELIEHCTEKNLTKRYRTTEEVSGALVSLKNAS